jgi:hypothetical protein
MGEWRWLTLEEAAELIPLDVLELVYHENSTRWRMINETLMVNEQWVYVIKGVREQHQNNIDAIKDFLLLIA